MQKALLENQDLKEKKKFESYNRRGTMDLCETLFPNNELLQNKKPFLPECSSMIRKQDFKPVCFHFSFIIRHALTYMQKTGVFHLLN